MNPIYPDFTSNDLYSRTEVEEFFRLMTADPGGYVQAARLANLPYSLYAPLVNCLLGGLMDVSDLASIPALTERAATDAVDEALVRHRMASYQDGDIAKLEYVYFTLNMHEFIPPYLVSRNSPEIDSRQFCFKWEYFSKRRGYVSYAAEAEFLEEYDTLVLPELPFRTDPLAVDKLRSSFPEDGGVLFESLPDPVTAGRFSRAYGLLLSRYLPSISDDLAHRLTVSSPRKMSEFESNLSYSRSLIGYYHAYKNTQDVIDEVVAMMAEHPEDGDTIPVDGAVHTAILADLSAETFDASPARALNRFILLTEVKKRVEEDPAECDTDGANILLEKVMQFIDLSASVSDLCSRRLRVVPL